MRGGDRDLMVKMMPRPGSSRCGGATDSGMSLREGIGNTTPLLFGERQFRRGLNGRLRSRAALPWPRIAGAVTAARMLSTPTLSALASAGHLSRTLRGAVARGEESSLTLA